MYFPKELTTITPVSKAVALIMFISLPVITFIFGMRYQTILTEQNKTLSPPPSIVRPTMEPIGCTKDAKICPDGSVVGRVGPNCKFEKCPLVEDPTTQTFCGGIAGKLCPSGYYCKYEGTYPDAGGTCIKDKITTKFSCPKTEWVNCMPGPGSGNRIECASDFLAWAQENCPDFKGAAL